MGNPDQTTIKKCLKPAQLSGTQLAKPAFRGGRLVNWQVGITHAPSPDVRCGHPALRSLGCRHRSAILAALVCIRRLSGRGQSRPHSGQEGPEAGPTLRRAAGKARAECQPGRPASKPIRGDEATIEQGRHARRAPKPPAISPWSYQAKCANALFASAMRWTFSRLVTAAPSRL